MNGLPDAFEVVISKLENRVGDPSNPLTFSELRDELNLKFE